MFAVIQQKLPLSGNPGYDWEGMAHWWANSIEEARSLSAIKIRFYRRQLRDNGLPVRRFRMITY